jgi:hypothetical protein
VRSGRGHLGRRGGGKIELQKTDGRGTTEEGARGSLRVRPMAEDVKAQ